MSKDMKIIRISKERLNAIYGYWNEESFDKRPEHEKACIIADGIAISPEKEETLKEQTEDAFQKESEVKR